MAESVELRRVLVHLQTAHRLAGIGSWTAELAGSHRLLWSPQVHEITGIPLDEQPSFGDFVAMIHPDDRPLYLDLRAAALRGDRPYDIDVRVILPDGDQRQVNIAAEVVRDEDGNPVRLVGAVQDRTAELDALRRLRLTEVSRRDLLQRLLDTADTERSRLARHLESGPIDRLVEIERRLAAEVPEGASQLWTDALLAVRKAIESLGQMLSHIQADPASTDLDHTIAQLVAESAPDVEVTVDLDLDGPLRPTVQAVLLRLVQEALHNVRKHAAADRATVSCSLRGDCVHVAVTDDGRGFDVDAVTSERGHLGIVAMRDRLASVGGELDIRSRPGHTAVEARIPLR